MLLDADLRRREWSRLASGRDATLAAAGAASPFGRCECPAKGVLRTMGVPRPDPIRDPRCRPCGGSPASASRRRSCCAARSGAAPASRRATAGRCCSSRASWPATARSATMTHWLRANGYWTRRAGIRANVGCSEEACERLEERLEALAARTGQPGGDHRPEPRRRARPRGRRAPARPRLGHRHARRADGRHAARAPARAAAGRARRRARHRPRAGPVPHELPARRAVASPSAATSCGPFPPGVRYVSVYSRTRRDRRLARLPRRGGRRAGRDPRLALRHGGQPRRLRAGRRGRWPPSTSRWPARPRRFARAAPRDSMCGVCGNMSTGRTRTSR